MPPRKQALRRYIAFLRAINVGGHTVKMDRLRAIFESLGLTKVETFIASGNVIFESASTDPEQLERKIERRLKQALGYEVATFIRSPAELAAVADRQPFASWQEGNSLYIALLPGSPTAEAQNKLSGFCNEIDDFHVAGREVYWRSRKGFSESTFSGALLEKTLGMPATLRNVTTVRRLVAKYPAG